MASGKKGAVGIVGLGIMGGAFAENLVAAGWRVIGYDVAPERRRALARLGVEIAADAADVARKTRTIITSLPNPNALAATVTEIAKAEVPRRVMVETSTFTLEDKSSAEAALRKAGHVMLDCPMSGTGAQAKVERSRGLCFGRCRRDQAPAPDVRRLSRAPCTMLAPSATAAG